MCNCNENINSVEVSAGPAGPTGPQGEDGYNAFGTTDAIAVSIGGNQYRLPMGADGMHWPVPGQIIYVENCGYYRVDSIVTGDYLVITDLLYSGNSMTAALNGSGLKVSPSGPRGATGNTGPQGDSANEWFAVASITGQGALGSIGDFCLEGNTGDIYEKTGASTWSTTGYNIKGPQGATGATGATGGSYFFLSEVDQEVLDTSGVDVLVGPIAGLTYIAYTGLVYIESDEEIEITVKMTANGTTIPNTTVKISMPPIISGASKTFAVIPVVGSINTNTYPGHIWEVNITKARNTLANSCYAKLVNINYRPQ